MKRTGPITDGLWRRWPIPKEGAEIEVARYRREATSSKNAVEHMFFIRIRIVATGLLKSIEFRSYWRERDVVTEREFYDFPIPCGEAEVQILSVREKKRWLGLWVVSPREMKGRKIPIRLERVFSEVEGRVRAVADHEIQRCQRARDMSEEREGSECF